MVHSGSGFLSQECQTAAGAATEASFAVARGFDELSSLRGGFAGGFVVVLVAAQITGVVVNHGLLAGLADHGEAGAKRAMVLDGDVGAELFVVLADCPDAVGTGAEDLGRFFEGRDVLLGQRLKEEVVAEAASGVAGTALLFQDAEGDLMVAEKLD